MDIVAMIRTFRDFFVINDVPLTDWIAKVRETFNITSCDVDMRVIN